MLSTRRQGGIDEIAHLHALTVSNLNHFIVETLLEVLWSPLAQCRPFSHGIQDHSGSIAAHVTLQKNPGKAAHASERHPRHEEVESVTSATTLLLQQLQLNRSIPWQTLF